MGARRRHGDTGLGLGRAWEVICADPRGYPRFLVVKPSIPKRNEAVNWDHVVSFFREN